jgi:tetratricopeptide (TPR) repeat protein
MLDLRRRVAPALLVVVLGMAISCAPPPQAPSPTGDTPIERGAGKAGTLERQELQKAYDDLHQGKASSAESRFHKLLQRAPGLLPARTGIAYVRLRTGRYPEAERLFEEILATDANDLDALLGLGETEVKKGDLAAGVRAYARAAEVRGDDKTVRKRLADAKLQFTEKSLAAARAARDAGDNEKTIEAYQNALAVVPEVAGLRLELADVLVQGDNSKDAIDVLAADPTSDPQVSARLGELRMKTGDFEGAVAAYRKAVERDAHNGELGRRLTEAEHAYEFSRMPEEYQRIFNAPFITRADLAALIDVKVTALSRVSSSEPQVAVDISGSWAKEHIIKTLAFDIISVYANHTFQPAALVRRGDLARAVARVLDVLHWKQGSPVTIADMTPSHLYYDAAVRAVSAGLMDLSPEGAFNPSERVSGREAAEVIDALSHLVGP